MGGPQALICRTIKMDTPATLTCSRPARLAPRSVLGSRKWRRTEDRSSGHIAACAERAPSRDEQKPRKRATHTTRASALPSCAQEPAKREPTAGDVYLVFLDMEKGLTPARWGLCGSTGTKRLGRALGLDSGVETTSPSSSSSSIGAKDSIFQATVFVVVCGLYVARDETAAASRSHRQGSRVW
ncbi:hypothetical protein MRX96_004123 [Rhipicephalus microplus]